MVSHFATTSRGALATVHTLVVLTSMVTRPGATKSKDELMLKLPLLWIRGLSKKQ